jgi:D-alanyl-lipoteichoic acid acyltransferase DltB (MBOAT superfamily)
MLFNSLEFAVFVPVVFGLYWGAPRGLRNHVILVASYVFYGWWDWRFLALLAFSSAVDYGVGIGLLRSTDSAARKRLLGLSIVVNLGLLSVFKYCDFFLENLSGAISFLGVQLGVSRLGLVLPVGISFYTFQKLSYTIDVYRGRVEPCRDPVRFFCYAGFFPTLLAGPIERPDNLLRQFSESKQFDYGQAVNGLRQILWGLFKKVVVADGCAELVNPCFANPGAHSSSTLALAAVLYSVQIYGDFSGYSDMAIGTARLFGFELKQNFAYPYFARDIAEFWRRWHISLTSWFRDYLYIPLGGNRGSKLATVRNTFIVFLVSGLWHGANWTFILWGFLHALFFLPLLLAGKTRQNRDDVPGLLPRPVDAVRMLGTFLLVTIAWIFFRADDVQTAWSYLGGMVGPSLFSKPTISSNKLLLFIALMLVVEWFNRRHSHGLVLDERRIATGYRWAGYFALVFMVIFFSGKSGAFIYFQF